MLCRTLWVSVLLAVGVGGCKKSVDRQHVNHTAGSDPGTAVANSSTTVDRGDDPCIYLAATEAEAFVGPLETPPFRFDESAGAPSIDGDHCMYRGRGGGEIMVDVLAGGAKMGAAAMAGVPRVMGRMLKATGHENQAGVPAAISQAGEQGPWDNSQWLSVIGTLETVKGDSGLLINVAVSRAGEQGAYVLAREAMPRLDKPLDYDGAHAAMLAPKPRAPLANPCDLIPRGRVEQAIGPLAGEPERDESGETCTYHVTGANGTQEYPLDITWVNGNKALAMLKGSVAAAAPALGMPAGGALGMPAGSALPPAAQQILSQVSKMTGGVLAAPSLTHGLATDTTLAGPWDAAALVGGTMLAATKHNVMVQLILGSADYDKAKALLAAACERL